MNKKLILAFVLTILTTIVVFILFKLVKNSNSNSLDVFSKFNPGTPGAVGSLKHKQTPSLLGNFKFTQDKPPVYFDPKTGLYEIDGKLYV